MVDDADGFGDSGRSGRGVCEAGRGHEHYQCADRRAGYRGSERGAGVLDQSLGGGGAATFMLSYNSQNWRQDGGMWWNLGKDSGMGYGWRLQAGSIMPVYYLGEIRYCIFVDATGAEYRMDNYGGIFITAEGPKMW